MTSILDFFILCIRSIPLFFSANQNDTDATYYDPSSPGSVTIDQIPRGNITFGDKFLFYCNRSLPAFDKDKEEMDKLSFEWLLHLNNSDVISFPKKSGQLGAVEIVFNKTDKDGGVKAISCRTVSEKSGSIISETTHPLTFIDKITSSEHNRNSDCDAQHSTNCDSFLPSPRNITAAYIEGRSVVISWMAPEIKNSSAVLEYIIEYKKTILDWNNGIEQIKTPADQLSAHIQNLKPWTTYHLRVVAIYLTGESAPSYPIVVLTPEERPSGAPQNVEVKVLDDHTLQVSWKPAPRDTWNGAILGYNIGSKKATSSDEESYTFHVLTARELLGRPCVHEISVPDSSIPYKVIVQAFNNIGPGPISLEAISESSSSQNPVKVGILT